MRITLVYICPVEAYGTIYFDYAQRFVATYHLFHPEIEHQTIVVSNGGKPSGTTRILFSSMGAKFIAGDNVGQDIGGYLKAASIADSELAVFFGSSAYFRVAGWLERVRDSFLKYGDTLYGACGHQGAGNIHPHIRTTGFWMRPELLTQYCPNGIGNERRYEFEHGKSCLSNWIKSQGKQPMVVTLNGEYPLNQCDSGAGGYHNGQQENLLFGDRMCEPPYHHCA